MILVSCSVKVHAFQLAAQLERHSLLSQFYTLIHEKKNPLVSRFMTRQDREKIPLDRIKTFWWMAAALRLTRKPYMINSWFDQCVSEQLSTQTNCKAFIGWSGMSLKSILQAKKQGCLTVLERGSSHIGFQVPLLEEEFDRWGFTFQRNTALMDQELSEYEEADVISVPSGFVEQTFLQQGIPAAKLFRNNYGVNNFFVPVQPKRRPFTILYVGALSLRKGLPYFFEALKKLRIPQHLYEVWLVGSVQPEIRKLASEYNQSNWTWWGHVNHYQLADMISPSSVAVQPSLEEGLSMVIPQLMACGVPVIATTHTGGADIITDGVDGFLIPIRSPEAIAERLTVLFEDSERLHNMQQLAIRRVTGSFTWDHYGDRYAKHLLSLLGTK